MNKGRPRKWGISEGLLKELQAANKQATSVKDKTRLQVALLAAQGVLSLEQIAQSVGCARASVQNWLYKLQEGGVSALLKRGKAPGNKPSLSKEQQKLLSQELAKGRQRTAKQIGRWLQQQWGVELKTSAVYYWLGKLGAVLRVARPQHREHKEQAAAEFRFGLLEKLRALPLRRDEPVKVWVQDEGRFGLLSFTRRVWTLRGIKPVVKVRQRYQWRYVFAAMECGGGGLEAAYWESVELGVTRRFLEQIAGSDEEAQHVVIYDGAGFHLKAQAHDMPQRVHVVQLPGYSPQLNPVEGLWDDIRDELCNKTFESVEHMEREITPLLEDYWRQPQRVLSRVHGWIRRIVNASPPNIIPSFN